MKSLLKALVLVALVSIVAIAAGVWSGGKGGDRKSRGQTPPAAAGAEKPSKPSPYAAYFLAKKEVEKMLHDPSSATFEDRFFAERKDGLFEVGGTVRAKNPFGAMVQHKWRAVTTTSYVVQFFQLGDHVEGVYVPDQGAHD